MGLATVRTRSATRGGARRVVAALVPLLLLAFAPGQEPRVDAGTWRYEAGLRLRALERAWAAADEERRGAVVEAVDGAVQRFFRADMAGVARAVDGARAVLEAGRDERTGLERLADALAVLPERRAVEPGRAELAVRVVELYGVEGAPEGAAIDVRIGAGEPVLLADDGAGGRAAALPLAGLGPGRHGLVLRVRAGDAVVERRGPLVSLVPELAQRLERLDEAVGRRSRLAPTAAAHTAHLLLGQLEDLVDGDALETDLDAGALLARAEELAALAPDARTDAFRAPGSHYAALPLERGTAVVRLFVPEGLAADARVPVVVALHGAGGSENLFFEGYGDGLAVELARERGWVLVAPRVGFLGCPVAQIVDELAPLVPLDPGRVVVVGHSMGAAAAVGAASKTPDRLRALAALGGGGAPEAGAAAVPTFVAAGATDFGRPMAEGLARELRRLGAEDLVERTYERTEHLLVVQRALPDVFAFFDRRLEPGER